MHKLFLIKWLYFIVGMSFSTTVLAVDESSNSACESYDRPNIDCVCVAKRMQVYLNATELGDVKQLLKQRYLHALGLQNTLLPLSKKVMSQPKMMIAAEMNFDHLGGMPENIEDFERGCVLETTQVVRIDEPLSGSAAAKFAESRTKIVGQAYKRNSFCIANKMSLYMTQAEIEAYHLSYSYYEGDHSNDDVASRAKKMGLSKLQYQQLVSSGRSKFEKNNELDGNYCNAVTYAEHFSSKRIKSEKEQEALHFYADKGVMQANTDISQLNDREKAEHLMQSYCVKQGGSKTYCDCVMTDFGQKVVKKAQRPGVVLAWVMMRHGGEMDSQELMQITLQSNRQDQQQAAQMYLGTLDVGASCEK